jgi:hypothetical protein
LRQGFGPCFLMETESDLMYGGSSVGKTLHMVRNSMKWSRSS